MFRALLTHSQEVLHKWHLVYRVRVMSIGCMRIGVPVAPGLEFHSSPGAADITRMQYTKCRFIAPPEDEQVKLQTYKSP
jgi:hypothetical protein